MRTSRAGRISQHTLSYGAALLFVIPVYILLNLAFRPLTDLSPALIPTTNPTLDNFVQAWTQSSLGKSVVSSVIVTTVSSLALLIIATMASYPLARSTSKLSNTTFFVFLAGLLLPFQVALLPLYIQFKDLHLLGTLWSLIILYTGLLMPFSVFLITTFLRTAVPLEYEEAARIDGCTDIQVFRRIVLPLLRPVLGTLIVLNGVTIWNDFFTPLLYLAGSSYSTIPVAIYSFVGSYSTSWPLVFAGLIISMTPILIIFVIFQRYMIQGFSGGLKG